MSMAPVPVFFKPQPGQFILSEEGGDLPLLKRPPDNFEDEDDEDEDEEDALLDEREFARAKQKTLEATAARVLAEGPQDVPTVLVVSGSRGRRTEAMLSPRSGLMKRKEGDHLQLNGMYLLQAETHHDFPYWAKEHDSTSSTCCPTEAGETINEPRYIFRSKDGQLWIIDDALHDGSVNDMCCFARLPATAAHPAAENGDWLKAGCDPPEKTLGLISRHPRGDVLRPCHLPPELTVKALSRDRTRGKATISGYARG